MYAATCGKPLLSEAILCRGDCNCKVHNQHFKTEEKNFGAAVNAQYNSHGSPPALLLAIGFRRHKHVTDLF